MLLNRSISAIWNKPAQDWWLFEKIRNLGGFANFMRNCGRVFGNFLAPCVLCVTLTCFARFGSGGDGR
jgi:hypothetical protein